MHPLSRRAMLQLLAAEPVLHRAIGLDPIPQYSTKDARIEIHTTDGYPPLWKEVYQNTLDHFARKWGRVGPTHVFLVENADWDPDKSTAKDRDRLTASQKELKRRFCELQGRDSDGAHLDWKTGNHWTSWSVKPANLMITMTMTPYRDAEQFVIGPIHEYLHAYQIAYGYAKEAIQGNQMGHSLWTGPAWWREGSSVLVAALYGYQHPELFKRIGQAYSWNRLSQEMNRNLGLYTKAKTSIRRGVTHDDWKRLEQQRLVHPVVYAGGSVACALLMKKVGSLEKFMQSFALVSTLSWQTAFEKHFNRQLKEFYGMVEKEIASATVQRDPDAQSDNWCSFLKTIN